jgi:hypothetical protein
MVARWRRGGRSIRVLVVLLLASALACGFFKSESPLVGEERERREAIESVEGLSYRAIKIAARSAASEDQGEGEGQAQGDASSREIRRLGESLIQRAARAGEARDGDGERDAPTKAEYLAAARELYALREELRDADEDAYPTLLSRIYDLSGSPPEESEIFVWYASEHEHVVLALLWLGANKKVPRSFRVYEASKLEPAKIEDPSMRLVAHAARGGTYLRESWPFLAEQEADAYLETLERSQVEILRESRVKGIHERLPTGSDEEIIAAWHAPGVLLRGLARLRRGERDLAVSDLGAFVSDSEALGADDEFVWLAGAYVALHEGDTERALGYLRRLEASELLTQEDRALVRQAILAAETDDREGALESISGQVLVARIGARYVVQRVASIEWKRAVSESESGKKLEELGERMASETEKVRESLSSEELERLGDRAKVLGEQLKDGAGDRGKDWAEKTADRAKRELEPSP